MSSRDNAMSISVSSFQETLSHLSRTQFLDEFLHELVDDGFVVNAGLTVMNRKHLCVSK